MPDRSKKNAPPNKTGAKPKKPAAPQPAEDEEEDGDIATPKRDRYGPDDEPL